MLKMFLNTAFHVLLMKYLANSAISKTGLCESGCTFNVCLVHTLQLLFFFSFFWIFEKGDICIFMKSK